MFHVVLYLYMGMVPFPRLCFHKSMKSDSICQKNCFPFFTAIYFMPVRPTFYGSGGEISWECVN